MKKAFTLVEVLITLGIIGVIAAITIPMIIQNYQKQVTVNQLKIAFKIFSEAIDNAKLDFGGELPISNNIVINPWLHSPSFSKIYLDPYLKGAVRYTGNRIPIYDKTKSTHFIIYDYVTGENAPMCLPNGFCYWAIAGLDTETEIFLVVDLNGIKGPNVAGRDIFVFQFELNSNKNAVIKLSLPDKDFNWTRDTLKQAGCADKELYSRPGTGQKYFNGINCSTLIVKDGWQILPDYNW